MNLATPVNQFLSAATGGAKDGQLDMHASGIRTQTFDTAAGFPNHFTACRLLFNEYMGKCVPQIHYMQGEVENLYGT